MPDNKKNPSEHAGRGSLSGRWARRVDGLPNLRGALTIDCDLPSGTKLWLVGWTKAVGVNDAEFVSLTARVAVGGPRKVDRRRDVTAEPEGKFRDVDHGVSLGGSKA